ncbi:MAG TPA: glucose-6-phosphate dehydrogenase [Stellaceae bacterium]|nr:glucose-6-phosphate dehydrogenase [Stellaceae bacterium]
MAQTARRTGRQAHPCTMVIFGASGDLTRRLLMPALYNLAKGKLIPDEFRLVGLAIDKKTDEEFRASLSEFIRGMAGDSFDEEVWNALVGRMTYMSGDFKDPAVYQQLIEHLGGLDSLGNVLFYMAVAPDFISTIVDGLHNSHLTDEQENGWRRVVVEKPFGHDLDSAKDLNAMLLRVLEERQIYRIDHYLGKETVQNIMVFRFANGIFEPLWNRDHIDHVQITVGETVGVENRGAFYEVTGALRDMIQNHLFQVLSFVAMEVPTSFDADALRSEKVKVLEAIKPFTPEMVLNDTVRGQYAAGMLGDKQVCGYRQEPHVSPQSETETYAAMKLSIENWRWAGVPFYIRTGKRLARRVSEVAVQFKRPPIALFRGTPIEDMAPNLLIIRVQPDEGIALQFGAKVPGANLEIGKVDMNFQYKDYFQVAPATGYETLILDCMIGDQTLFQRADNVEVGWRVVQPVIDTWADRRPRGFPNYEAGSGGPEAGHQLLARDGQVWRRI